MLPTYIINKNVKPIQHLNNNNEKKIRQERYLKKMSKQNNIRKKPFLFS